VNQVLKYPGSKWRIASWIISHFPEHHSYLEPYFGSGAVLFTKKRSNIETVNDLDNTVSMLFQMVRDSPDQIARIVNETPFARYEYDSTFCDSDPANDIERVRRFLIQCWMGHGFRTNGRKVGWKHDVQGRERSYALSNWNRLPAWIMEAANRLKEVQIENRPAVEVMKAYRYPNVLIYADPPYVLSTRTGKQYKHEMNEKDHQDMLNTLKEHPGLVVLSGYDSELYRSELKGWHTETINSNAEYYNGKARTEVIWMNFESSKQLQMSDTTLHK